jgi:hypothetical protein
MRHTQLQEGARSKKRLPSVGREGSSGRFQLQKKNLSETERRFKNEHFEEKMGRVLTSIREIMVLIVCMASRKDCRERSELECEEPGNAGSESFGDAPNGGKHGALEDEVVANKDGDENAKKVDGAKHDAEENAAANWAALLGMNDELLEEEKEFGDNAEGERCNVITFLPEKSCII